MSKKQKPTVQEIILQRYRPQAEGLQAEFSAIQNMQDTDKKFLALHNFSSKINDLKETIQKDIAAMLTEKEDVVLGGTFLGVAGTVVAATAATAIAFTGFGAIFVGLGSLAAGTLIFSATGEVVQQGTKLNKEKLSEIFPEALSLNALEKKLKTERQNFFETPDSVSTIVKSPEFPSLFGMASADEKKVLSYAFRLATQGKEDEISRLSIKSLKDKPSSPRQP